MAKLWREQNGCMGDTCLTCPFGAYDRERLYPLCMFAPEYIANFQINDIMKLTIVAQEAWATKDRKSGNDISGFSFIAYTPNDKVIKFTSKRKEHITHVGQVGFDPTLAEDVEIKTRMFGNEIRYQEVEEE